MHQISHGNKCFLPLRFCISTEFFCISKIIRKWVRGQTLSGLKPLVLKFLHQISHGNKCFLPLRFCISTEIWCISQTIENGTMSNVARLDTTCFEIHASDFSWKQMFSPFKVLHFHRIPMHFSNNRKWNNAKHSLVRNHLFWNSWIRFLTEINALSLMFLHFHRILMHFSNNRKWNNAKHSLVRNHLFWNSSIRFLMETNVFSLEGFAFPQNSDAFLKQ